MNVIVTFVSSGGVAALGGSVQRAIKLLLF